MIAPVFVDTNLPLLTEDFQTGQDLAGLLVANPFRNDPRSLLDC
jgi:hypothetical protein